MNRWASLPLRIITGVTLLALVFAVVFFDGWYLYSAVLLVTVMGTYEVSKALSRTTVGRFAYLNGLLSLAMPAAVLFPQGETYIAPLLLVGICVVVCINLARQVSDLKDYALSIFGFLYPSVFFAYFLLICHIPHRSEMLTAFFIVTLVVAATDVFAYFTGMLMGKRPLCPLISPKKTVEGAVGGLVGSMLVSLAIGLSLPYFNMTYSFTPSLWHFVVLGIVGGILGEFGDLLASIVKRSVGIKDYAGVLPGMGGIMDRMDGILFAAPFIFYYFTLIIR